MGILNITEAVREGARLVIGLAGVSGSGKTRTALEIAWGLAKGDSSKIGFLDTENRRGRLYAECLVGTDGKIHRFKHADLYAPFSPQRYSQAIKEFQEAGVEVLVIDSVTHEYDNEGGYLEIREPLPGKSGKRDNVAAAEHKKFMRTMLQCDMHAVVCVRAREKVKIEKGQDPETGKFGTIYVPQGLQPIQHRDFMFEMTASLMIHDQGQRRDVIKCPAELMEFLGHDRQYLTARDGMLVRKWVDGGTKLDPEVERARNVILSLTGDGLLAVNENWETLTPKIKKSLGQQFIDMARSSAQEFDAQAEARNQVDNDIDMSSGGFNPMTAVEPDMVAAHKPDDAPPQYDDDPFADSGA